MLGGVVGGCGSNSGVCVCVCLMDGCDAPAPDAHSVRTYRPDPHGQSARKRTKHD